MTYLFDSDVIISHLHNKFDLTVIPSTTPAISVITYAELLYGVQKINNPTKQEKLDGLLRDLHIEILPVTPAIVKRFTTIKLQTEGKGEKLADFDLLIAATALEHNLTLITNNKKHFQRIKGLNLA